VRWAAYVEAAVRVKARDGKPDPWKDTVVLQYKVGKKGTGSKAELQMSMEDALELYADLASIFSSRPYGFETSGFENRYKIWRDGTLVPWEQMSPHAKAHIRETYRARPRRGYD